MDPRRGRAAGGARARREPRLDYKDAIVVSPHKFIGGPGTPGVLVARRELFRNRVPPRPAAARSPTSTRSSTSTSTTPSIARRAARRRSSSRSGRDSSFALKEAVGVDVDPGRGRRASSSARSRPGRPSPGSGSSGNPDLPRLSIVSFTVRHDGRYLHHNFVVALLNDLFGIQSRGGCSCAGPYGHRLLGIDIETSHAFEREISRGCEGIKPGWIRVNFNYFISEAVFDYIVRAVAMVARDGWRLLPWYRFESATGMWRHAAGSPEPPLSLHDVAFGADGVTYPAHRHAAGEEALAGQLDSAARILANPVEACGAAPPPDGPSMGSEDFESLRWFWLPEELRAAVSQP